MILSSLDIIVYVLIIFTFLPQYSRILLHRKTLSINIYGYFFINLSLFISFINIILFNYGNINHCKEFFSCLNDIPGMFHTGLLWLCTFIISILCVKYNTKKYALITISSDIADSRPSKWRYIHILLFSNIVIITIISVVIIDIFLYFSPTIRYATGFALNIISSILVITGYIFQMKYLSQVKFTGQLNLTFVYMSVITYASMILYLFEKRYTILTMIPFMIHVLFSIGLTYMCYFYDELKRTHFMEYI
jgi:hypothetical protein